MSDETASSVISSVLGFVSREIQDFVVSAVTGTATTSSQPLGSSSSNLLKHKRSKSAVRSVSANGQSAGKRSRRPSVSQRDDVEDGSPSRSRRTFTEPSNQENWQNDAGPSTTPLSRDGPLPRARDTSKPASKGLMGPPPTPPFSASRTRTTMPGSLFPRSPTPAEFRDKPLPPPFSPRRPIEHTSPDSETRINRGRRRSVSHVRFDPVVVRRIDRPRSPPTTTPEPTQAEPTQTQSTSQPAEPTIKVEDDEIQILDRMPSPPRGRDASSKRILNASEASSSRRPASPPYEPITNHADMSISEFTTQEKGKAKEVFPDHGEDSENSKVQALMEEIRRLKSELANQSSTNSAFSMPPPAPPPPPPPGYIAIPATSWKNGPKHPSQRAEVPKLKSKRKSLQSTVPVESMEAFLSELKTVKLRSTGAGPKISPMTLRRQQNTSISSTASDVSTGLLTLRAQLKRKDVPDADRQEAEVPRNAPRRRLEDSPPLASPPHQDFEHLQADNSGSTSLSSGNEDAEWREEGHSMSWSFPGPSRSVNYGRFPNRPVETRPKPTTSLTSSRVLYESRLNPLRHGAGPTGSDMTTPSLCSDTEEHPQESFKSTQPDEDLLTPCEDEMAGLPPAIAPSGPINPSQRTSDLHLDELIERRFPSPLKKQTEQRQPPKSIRLAKRTSHPPPVEGSPNVFSSSYSSNVSISRTPKSPPKTVVPPRVFTSRPPKSPLPLEPRPQKPKPPRSSSVGRSPMRNSTTRNNATASLGSTLTQSRSNRASIPSSFTPSIPAPEEVEDDHDPAPGSTPSPSISPNLHPIQLPLPDPRYATFRKSTGLRTARNHLDASLYSLDDELRAVSANERIAELDLDLELGDMDIDMTVTLEEDVFSGTGIRSNGSGFTSGGGGGGIAVTSSTYDMGGASQPSSRSRIPVMGRSR